MHAGGGQSYFSPKKLLFSMSYVVELPEGYLRCRGSEVKITESEGSAPPPKQHRQYGGTVGGETAYLGLAAGTSTRAASTA
jgi:hypothetical protein